MITTAEINVNENWTLKDIQPEMEVGIMQNNRKIFILKCGNQLMDVETIHKYLCKISFTTSAEKVLSGQ